MSAEHDSSMNFKDHPMYRELLANRYLQQAAEYDSLTVANAFNSENEDEKYIESAKFSLSRDFFYKTYTVDQYMAYIRVFFSLPLKKQLHIRYRMDAFEDQGSILDYIGDSMSFFREVNPQFVPSSDEEMYASFDALHDFLLTLAAHGNIEEFSEYLERILGLSANYDHIRGSGIVSSMLWYLLPPCLSIFRAMGLTTVDCRGELQTNSVTGAPTLFPETTIKCEDIPLMVFRVVSDPDRFLVGDRLNEQDSYLRHILRQCNGYMYSMDVPCVFITNFDTTILLEWEISHERSENASDDMFVCGYRYRVIRLCDRSITLQAVITAQLMRQLVISIRRGFIDVNSSWLQKWLQKEKVMRYFHKAYTQAEAQKAYSHCVVMSAEARASHIEEFLIRASERVKKYLEGETMVDLSWFASTLQIQWSLQNNLEKVKEDRHLRWTQYSFTYTGNWDTQKLISVPPLGSKLSLKVYRMEMDDFILSPWVMYFCKEVMALSRILKHNEQSDTKIGVPEVYGYGRMVFCERPGVNLGWFYILTSDVADDDGMTAEEVNNARTKLVSDRYMIEELGIDLRDAPESIQCINRETPMYFDYSHADITREGFVPRFKESAGHRPSRFRHKLAVLEAD